MFSLAESKQTILRVKRLRAAAREDELILEAELPSNKRLKLDEHMRSMMLGSSRGDPIAGDSASAGSRRRRRFVLLTTVTEDMIQGDDSSALKKLLSSTEHPERPTATRAAHDQVHLAGMGERPRYQQVKRQLQGDLSVPPSSAPPSPGGERVSEHFHVYELEQLQQQQQQEGRGVDSQQVAVFMSMMEEYYQQQGTPVPEDISAAKQVALSGCIPVAGPLEATGGSSCSNGYVWDVYIPMEGAWEQGQEEEEYGVAVVQVEGEGDLQWWEGLGDDEEEEGHSEDSNAESYSGNTYPDENSSFYDEQEQCCASDGSNNDGDDTTCSSDDGKGEVRWDAEKQCTYVAPRSPPMSWAAVDVEELEGLVQCAVLTER